MANKSSPITKRRRSGLNSGLDLIEALAAADGPMTLTTLASSLGMSKAGVFEQLSTLTRRGYVERSASNACSIGMKLWELGCKATGLALARVAAPHMAALSREINEGVILGALDGVDVVYLHLVESPQAVRVHAEVGDRIPAHCTSTGLALLASLPAAEVERRLPAELAGLTGETLRMREKLLAELTRTRARGFAVNRGGWRSDVGGIAVTIRDRAGETQAALCVAVPRYRLTRKWVAGASRALMAAAEKIGSEVAVGPIGSGMHGIALRRA